MIDLYKKNMGRVQKSGGGLYLVKLKHEHIALNSYTILEFKKSLQVSNEEARSIERSTVLQKDSPSWFRVTKYRITASVFGDIMHRRADTPPDKLVLRILEQRWFQSIATQWGLDNESYAVQEY